MAKPRSAPIGTQIDTLWKLREDKRSLEEQVKGIEEKIGALEASIMERLDMERTDRSASKRASVHITENIVPVTKDWEAFGEYVLKTKQIHLVERRPSVLACREVWEQGGAIPGLEAYLKRKLNIRTIN